MTCIPMSATARDDAELIAETLQGIPESFGVLVRKYQDRLYNAMAHLTGNMDDARDVVQDALVQAFRGLASFRNTSAFYTWLYRIAFNVAASRRRRRRIFTSLEQVRENCGSEPVDAGPAPGEQLDQDERCQFVRHAIGQLAEEHRAVLVLREMDGLRYEEIADILNLPVGTVRSRLHRARMQLRDLLAGRLAPERFASGDRPAETGRCARSFGSPC